MSKVSFGDAIRLGFEYCLDKDEKVFPIGQGLWSPWYVGNTMKDLDQKYGKERIMDSPVSEAATTGVAIGASLCGYRPIVIHPRMDFMILATDQIVNQAAKWSHMLGGQAHPSVTIRGIVNRGGQQGAQHSQALHSWYSHIPGLRVVMPATVRDARDLMIAAVFCDDPVLYIDDRWLYELEEDIGEPQELKLSELGPQVLREGRDVTLVAASYSTQLAMQAAEQMQSNGISCEVIDLRVVNPLKLDLVHQSVQKTGRLIAIDGSWKNCGLAGEVLASVFESVPHQALRAQPRRITLPECPAPTAANLERSFYPDTEMVVSMIQSMFSRENSKYVETRV